MSCRPRTATSVLQGVHAPKDQGACATSVPQRMWKQRAHTLGGFGVWVLGFGGEPPTVTVCIEGLIKGYIYMYT